MEREGGFACVELTRDDAAVARHSLGIKENAFVRLSLYSRLCVCMVMMRENDTFQQGIMENM